MRTPYSLISGSKCKHKVTKPTRACAKLPFTIRILKNQEFGRHLIREIIPFLLRVVMDLCVFKYGISVDDITGHGVGREVYSGGVTEGERPVDEGAAEGMPYATYTIRL
jgi:hypothetical protein